MKQWTDAERLEIAMSLLSEYEVGVYENICEKRELGCPDGLCETCLIAECPYSDPLDPEANGFHNTPAECENFECRNCTMRDSDRQDIDCPYMDAV